MMRCILLILLCMPAFLWGQEKSEYEQKLEWVKKTFEENDAGFQYIIDKKGRQAYEIHNQLMLEKIRAAQSPLECNKLLYEWLTFFRSAHMGIRPLKAYPEPATETKPCYDILMADIPAFKAYAATLTEPDYEGVWELNQYKIGIRKEPSGEYTGFVTDSVEGWSPGMIKLRIERRDAEEASVFYAGDHIPRTFDAPDLIGPNTLQFGPYRLKRLSPALPEDPLVDHYLKHYTVHAPHLDRIDERTLLLRIPSFSRSQKPAIDSVLAVNRELILSTENLIIDLRYNGGGSDASYEEIRPFLYTGPVRSIGVEFLSTPLNNKQMLELADPKYGMTEQATAWYKKLEEHPGAFVNLFGEEVEVYKADTVYACPRNVGIIIHGRNASSAEQFLLEARQSRKVKLFGMHTAGALDISNLYSVESPWGDFELIYALSRSLRIPDFTIDDQGLQPDHFIDRSVHPYQWVGFVRDVISQ